MVEGQPLILPGHLSASAEVAVVAAVSSD